MTTEITEKDFPDTQDLAEQFRWAVDYWSARNDFIRAFREAINGRNEIHFPEKMQVKAKALHTFLLASILNEKTARYLPIPIPQVVVEDPLDPDSREESTELERALHALAGEMERKGNGDVWSRVTSDAVFLDGACELIERAPAAFWYELNDDGKYPMMSKQRENYKKEQGPPIRALYVPIEHTYPIYDGSICTKVFHTEARSLYSCRQNKLFDQSLFKDVATDGTNGMSTYVPIVRYADQQLYGYYAIINGARTITDHEGRRLMLDNVGTGDLVYLYGYRHGLGRVPYNFVGGRFGGWKTDNNAIEGVGKALMELSQGADEIFSQVYTNIRAKYWGSMKYIVDPEKRGYSTGVIPSAPTIPEGENITLFVGEDLVPLVQSQDDPTVPWMMDQIKEQLGKLGGSGVLFGQRTPGVDTGIQNAQQISQAEHLDEKLEQHLGVGANDHYTLILLHCREIGEKVWVHYSEKDQSSGRAVGKYLAIEPDDLSPLPRFDIQVRKPRPIDVLTSIRAAREATDDRNGKGPLYSDDTVREVILAMDYPDLEKKKIMVQEMQLAMVKTGIITSKIGELVNIKLAREGVPNISPESMGKADPALLTAMQGMVGGNVPPPPGGVDPAMLAGMLGAAPRPPSVQNPLDRSGGMLPTDPGMEARVGEMAAPGVQIG